MLKQFRAVVIGAGPVGLVLAHALSSAGIDFVCLERRDQLFEDVGASLILHPPTLRVLSQLGLYDDLMAIGTKIHRQTTMVADTGESWDSSGLTEVVTESHGIPLMAFHRAELIKCLYDKLPPQYKSKILTGKHVIDIDMSEMGVVISCNDGSVYNGSLVIGADGVSGWTRRIMHRLATSSLPDQVWDALAPFKSEYICLWCTCPRMAGEGQYFETQSHDRSVISITGHDREWILLFEKQTLSSEKRRRFSNEEMEQFAANFAEFPASPKYKVRDMFARRLTAGMTMLDEGMLSHWHYGRIVLVGDACHKMTPNAGFGFNNGVQDAVVLCNKIEEMLRDSTSSDIDSDTITNIFKDYQSVRQDDVQKDLKYSAHFTRIQAWANWIYYVFARWVRPYRVMQRRSARVICTGFSRSSVFSFLPAEERFQGSLPWVNPLPCSSEKSH